MHQNLPERGSVFRLGLPRKQNGECNQTDVFLLLIKLSLMVNTLSRLC